MIGRLRVSDRFWGRYCAFYGRWYMAMDLGRFDDEVWDRFFDFLGGDCDDMELEELRDLLGAMGDDIRRALKRVNKALESSRLGRDRDVDF